MMFNENAMPLMKKYQAALEVEARAMQALLSAMALGRQDADDLSKQYAEAHSSVMDIFDDLQQYKLGN